MDRGYTMDEVKAFRNRMETSLQQAALAFENAFDAENGLADTFQGDVLWAWFTLEAKRLAVNIRGADGARAAWNLSHGASQAEAWRERDPTLNDDYPTRMTGPAGGTALATP